jgi:hypothetical protein
MQQTVLGPDESDQNDDADFDDIEWELTCSAREAGFGLVPFTNLDFMRAATEYAQIRARAARPG